MNRFRTNPCRASQRQRGVVLVVALVVLLLLTILGISGMQGTLLQERMASNTQDRSLAFQAAEAALRAGEVASGTPSNIDYNAESNAAPSPSSLALAPPPDDASSDWHTATAYPMAGPPENPRYLIESQYALPPLEADAPLQAPLIQVTARGAGRTSVVVLQSIYKR